MKLTNIPAHIKALLITQMLFNIGFFLVVPFIAVELSNNLGVSGAIVGLVLGVRTFSQQGLFFLGGGLADRFGATKVLLIGVLIRVAGFLAVGFADSVASMLLGVILIGFAAALFSPAVESLLAIGGAELERENVVTRAHVFALNESYLRLGSLTGPLLGALLIPVGFSLVSFVGAGIFAGIFLLHLALASKWAGQTRVERTPAKYEQASTQTSSNMIAAWGTILRNRAFMLFVLMYATSLLAYNQQYLALPVELRRATGSDHLLSWYFAAAAIFVVLLQTRVTKFAEALPPTVALGGGFALMALAFFIVAACAPLQFNGWVALVPSAAMVLIMHIGEMLAVPIAKDLIGKLNHDRNLGSAYGILNSAGGVAVLLGSIGIGATLDWAETPSLAATIPWLIMTVLLTASAVGLVRMREQLDRRSQEQTSAKQQTSSTTQHESQS